MFYRMKKGITLILIILFRIAGIDAIAQISPGKLVSVHAHLEGISNCTQCHTLGSKVSNEKCLACHTDLRSRISQNKGFHASAEVSGKTCFTCHSDHHGENFQIIRFDKNKFPHAVTGFKLTGVHAKKECRECHKPEHIQAEALKKKKFTYLGLNPACLTCHIDYHQQTLGTTCADCHGAEGFKPAVKFNHARAKYQLEGQHKTVACDKCHKVTLKNGKKFQEFAGIQFATCTNCHTDPHHNQFGQTCTQCHNVESFHVLNGNQTFDHSKTRFRLEDKHKQVACKKCHINRVTDPVRHDKCMDCHKDFHEGQFLVRDLKPECSKCHTTKGFTETSFTFELHNNGPFRLEGGHVTAKCAGCHKKKDKWSFRNIGKVCVDCHKNIHETFLDPKFYPGNTCENCHEVSKWKNVKFDHSKTKFPLSEAHAKKDCRVCHFRKGPDSTETQKFTGLPVVCAD